MNKVSMFDKDLMCLVIFGLRGLNYTLKIQRALQCASHIRSNLRTVRGIHSVSVGVTAGMNYNQIIHTSAYICVCTYVQVQVSRTVVFLDIRYVKSTR